MKLKLIENYGLHFIEKKNILKKFFDLKQITNGKYCSIFEKKISKIIGCKYTVVCNSGTSALMMAILALKKKKIVAIVPNINFVAIINILKFLNAEIILSDVNQMGMTDDLSLLRTISYCKKKKIKPNIFIPIHYAGFVNNLNKIRKICLENNISLIDDGCHSFHSRYKDGSYVGNGKNSLMTTFSFHPVKNITTIEGGAVSTNKKYLYDRLLFLRSFCLKKTSLNDPYEAEDFSLNFRMGEFNAILGLSQLENIQKLKKKRIKLVSLYKKHFSVFGNAIKVLNTDGRNYFWHLLVIKLCPSLIQKKKIFMEFLKKKKIGCQIHYKPVNLHKKYIKIVKFDSLKESNKFYQEQLSIPLHYQMSEKHIIYIKKNILFFLKKNKLHKLI